MILVLLFLVLPAELWAICHGLSLTWGRAFRKIIVESDSANAVKLLSEINLDYHTWLEELKILLLRELILDGDISFERQTSLQIC